MTIKKFQWAVSAVLLASLGLFGFAAQQTQLLSRAEESNLALKKHEQRVIKALGLTAKQKTAYDALQAKLDADSAALATMKSGQIARGKEINAELHAGLKRIFKPEQYTKYMNMWAPADLKLDVKSGTDPFGGMDEAILGKLKLTSGQWAQYREYQRENKIKLQQYYDLMKKDQEKGATAGLDLNRWTRSQMMQILGEEKYYEWVRLWDQAMSPYVVSDSLNGSAVSPGRKAGAAGG